MSEESKRLLGAIHKCWGPVKKSYREETLLSQRGIKYSYSRDMANVLRAILPPAVEFAAAARPDWRTEDSPLATVAGKYALCLSSRDNGLDVLADGFAGLLDSKDEAEAFVLFSSALTLNLLVYMLCTPHLADTIGELYPNLLENAMAGISKAASWDVKGPWWRRWWMRRARKRELQELLASGTLPTHPWVLDFIQQKASGTITDIINDCIARGVVVVAEDVDGEEGA